MNTCKVMMFVSRPKDNKNLNGFSKREKVFFASKDVSEYAREFFDFVNAGVPCEVSRMYVSVNERNLDKAKKQLVCQMVSDDNFDLKKVLGMAVSCAMRPENAAEKHWLFDFDCPDQELLNDFLNDCREVSANSFQVSSTPNGFAVVADHGFDTRKVMEKWGYCVDLKRDAMLFLTKGQAPEK